MDLEQVVQHILLVRRDLSREDVLKKILDKKHSAQDYFLDEVAARLVASELGVEIPSSDEEFQPHVAIKDLISGLNDVTVVGRVIFAYPVQSFSRSDLTEGKVASLLLADKSGSIRLVLWNDKIDLLEKGEVREGNIARVLHGYVREGMDGKLELHVGQRGDVQVTPPDAVEADYPSMEQFFDKAANLNRRSRRVNFQGTVCEVYPVSEFKRKDGTPGKVRRIRLRDETGEVSVVFWNEKAAQLGETVERGDQLRLINARVKEQPDGRTELHVESATKVERLTGQPLAQLKAPCEATRRIADLKEEGGPFAIEATVATAPSVREVTTGQGERVLVASFDLSDDTGKIGMTLWRRHAETARALSVGTRIRIRDAYAKRGFSNLLELVSRTSTNIEVISSSVV